MKIKTKLTLQFTVLISVILLLILTLIYFVISAFLIADMKEKFKEEVLDFQNSFTIENYNIISVDTTYGEWQEVHHTLDKNISLNSVEVAVFDKNRKLLAYSENFNTLIDFENFLFNENHFQKIDSQNNFFYYSAPILVDQKICGWVLQFSQNPNAIDWLSFLKLILVISFFFGLVSAYFLSQIMATNSLSPISKIITNTKKITLTNFETKLLVSKNQDELDELATTLNDLIEKVNCTLKRMKQFTGDVSHEIRTPLTIIKGHIEVTLSRERTPAEYQETLKNCEEEIDRLSRITNGLLEIIRNESDNDNYEMTIVSLKEVIENVISKFKDKIKRKNLSIETKMESDSKIIGNVDNLTEIYFNLIENAIKYTETGKIQVEIKNENDNIVSSISDSGIGIPEKDLKAIFERFYQSQRTQGSGTGLGLSIVKKFVEKQNGKIYVKSQINKGSKFTIEFPQIIIE